MKRKVIFTEAGLKKLKKEQRILLIKRGEAVSELSRARDMGDRSENAAYKSARTALSRLDSKLRYLKITIDNAVIATTPQKGIIGIGSKVSLRQNEKIHNFEIAGDHESDVENSRISQKSPLGKALIGKKTGERICIHVPAGKIEYTIEKIY